MSDSGRYFVRDPRTGRTFCVEPISERNQRIDDLQWSNGGIQRVRGGSVSEEESIITPGNGFRNITHLLAGVSPDGYIEMLLQQEKEQ
ncbi:MAG TPA: hypothetical protein VHG28_01090 [Longimicrobiaceae bacterium]|nr:hypothetical protein [Longimicrobiaceae bacterium]